MTSHTRIRAPGTGASHALVVLVFVVAVGSVAPGTPVESWREVVAGLRAGATLAIQDPVFVTVLERLATFVPLGFLTFQHFTRRQKRHPVVWSCLAIALFALALELAQGVVQDRHARSSDFVLAVGFGCTGMILAAWLKSGPSPRQVRYLLVFTVIIGNVAAMLVVALTNHAAELGGWDCTYPLLVANERSGERPWLGRVRGLALYPRALAAHEVKDLVDAPLSPDGADVRRAMGGLAFYSFAAVDAGRVPQLLQHGPPSDLLLAPPDPSRWRVAADALEVRGPTMIRSAGPARELCEAVMKSKAFTAELEIAGTGVAQSGPARILSLSSDINHRNFTLGEEFGRLVVRVRTPWNGLNGTNLPLETEARVLTEGWHRVVFGYAADGTAFLFLDGSQIARLPYRTMILIGDESAIRIAVIVGLLLIATGAVASLLVRPRRWLIACVLVYGALLPALFVVGLAVWSGHDRDQLLLAAAAIGPGVGMIAARGLTAALARHQRIAALG